MRLFTIALLLAAPLAAAQVTEIASPAGAGSSAPFLSAARGALLLSWLEPVANSNRVAVRVARFRNGAWSAPATVVERNDLFVNWADIPSVVEDSAGVLFVHWLQKSGGSTYAYDVWMAASKDGGATWSAPFLLNRDGKKNEHGFVSLAPLPGGGVGAAWLDGRNMPEGKEEGEMSLRYAVVDARGAIRGETALDSRVCECCTTGMALVVGSPLIVYRDRSAEEIRDIGVMRKTANGWSKPRLVHADGWKIAGCPVNGPQADAVGKRVVVAWFTAANGQGHAFVAFSDDGGATFAAPVAVDDGKPAGRVDVAMIDARTAVVTWLEQTASGAEIRARRVPRDGKASPSVKIADSSTARGAGVPRMARLGTDVYVAWTEPGKRVHVARAGF